MISEGHETWDEVVGGGRGSEQGVFLTDSVMGHSSKRKDGG